MPGSKNPSIQTINLHPILGVVSRGTKKKGGRLKTLLAAY